MSTIKWKSLIAKPMIGRRTASTVAHASASTRAAARRPVVRLAALPRHDALNEGLRTSPGRWTDVWRRSTKSLQTLDRASTTLSYDRTIEPLRVPRAPMLGGRPVDAQRGPDPVRALFRVQGDE